MLKHICIILFIFSLQGCVGIGVVHKKESIIDCQTNLSKLDMLKKYSIKYSKPKIEKKDRLIYYIFEKKSSTFRGIIPMLLIGIPIILPFGSDNLTLIYKNNKCLKINNEYTDWSGFMCGLLNENGKFGCSRLGK